MRKRVRKERLRPTNVTEFHVSAPHQHTTTTAGKSARSTSHFVNPKFIHTVQDLWGPLIGGRGTCLTPGSWAHTTGCVCTSVYTSARLPGSPPSLPLPAATMIAFPPAWTCVIVSVELGCFHHRTEQEMYWQQWCAHVCVPPSDHVSNRETVCLTCTHVHPSPHLQGVGD